MRGSWSWKQAVHLCSLSAAGKWMVLAWRCTSERGYEATFCRQRSVHSTHLIPFDLISADHTSPELSDSKCALKRPSSLRLRPIRRDSTRPTLFRSVKATASWVASLQSTRCGSVQTKWGQVKWDEENDRNASFHGDAVVCESSFLSCYQRSFPVCVRVR